MKKFLACLVVFMMLNTAVYAASGHGHSGSHGSHSGHHSGSHSAHGHHGGHHGSHHGGHYGGHGRHHGHHYSSSSPVYLVSSDYKKEEEKFAGCNKHYMVVETYTNYYSDGTRRIYTNCTIYNSDGTILEADCQSVRHLFHQKQHFFIIRKNRGYSLINGDGNVITERSYSKMDEIAPDRLLVRTDKRYGIIDLSENLITDLKYKEFRKCGNNIYMTKLNGYYGIIDIDGKILIKNDCERMKPLYDTIRFKRYGKFGLADRNGNIILPAENNRIRRFGEYITVKKDGMTKILDSGGKPIKDVEYRKFKLIRNTLYGLNKEKTWTEVNPEL